MSMNLFTLDGKKHTFFFLEGLYKVPLHHLLALKLMQEGIALKKGYSIVEMCIIERERVQIRVIWLLVVEYMTW